MDFYSIPASVLRSTERFSDRRAIVDGETTLTYAQLGDAMRTATKAMIASGIEPGDRVAIWAPNRYEWVVAALGLQSAGAVLVPINTRFKGAEAADILGRSGTKLLVTVTGFLDIDPVGMLAAHRDELSGLETIVIVGDEATADVAGAAPGEILAETVGWQEFLSRGEGADAEITKIADERVQAVGPDDVSDILYTSGTTGRPKGVMMSHSQTLRQFSDWGDMVGLTENDRYLIVNPFFHMFGYKAGWLASLLRGATIFPVPVFDVDAVLGLVADESITVLPGPPTLYQSILDHEATSPGGSATSGRGTSGQASGAAALDSLRVAVTGAADIPVELIRRMHDDLPFETIITGYGLTEAGTVSATSRDDDFETIAHTVGSPRPGLEVQVVDQAGAPTPAGETGELLVRGYSVMMGYFDDPDATAQAIDSEGWLHTGDLATLDDRGYVRIVGRLKDMIIVGGFNAYPAEIENIMSGHPAISQVAVIGVPDTRMGEVPMAFVVPAAGANIESDEIITWSRENMANYKAPRYVQTVDELPLNATGKIVKDDLRARAEDLLRDD